MRTMTYSLTKNELSIRRVTGARRRLVAPCLVACALFVAGCSANDSETTGTAQAANTFGVLGDVDGDGIADISLTGGTIDGHAPWTSIPVAFSRSGPGYTPSFKVANTTTPDSSLFALYATQSGAKPVMGDFDGDGRADIALVGGVGWTSIPVAFSRSTRSIGDSNGTFYVTNAQDTNFAWYATQPGAQVVAGDFDGNGYCDLAIAGGSGWDFIVIAYSYGWTDGTFFTLKRAYPDTAAFATYASQRGAKLLAADFDHDRHTDLALTGGDGWGFLPVLYSRGNFAVRAQVPVGQPFAQFATQGALPVTGDFDNDGFGDVALVGGHNPDGSPWGSVPVAFSTGDGNGNFTVQNNWVQDFPIWALQGPSGHAQVVAGDFDGDGKSDLALTGGGSTQIGGAAWTTIPVTFSRGRAGFTTWNVSLGVAQFPLYATQRATAVSGSEARQPSFF